MGLYALGDLWRTNEFRTHLPQAWCRDPGCAELDQSGRRIWRRHDPGSSVRSGLGDELLHMAEVEWDHEAHFRAKCLSHGLRHVFPMWSEPPPRQEIRASFAREFPAPAAERAATPARA